MTEQTSQSFFRRKWKTIVILVAILACAYGLFGREAIQRISRERAILRIQQSMGNVVCAEPTHANPTFVVRWLRFFYGPDAFTEAWSADISPKHDSDLDALSQIPEIDSISIDCSHVSNTSLAKLWNKIAPSFINLKSANVNEELLGDVEDHENLLGISFDNCKLSEGGIERVVQCPKIVSLEFNECTFDATSLAKIPSNSGLNLLKFSKCSLDDSDLAALHGSESRMAIKLDESSLTESGIIALHKANKSWSIEIAVGQPDPEQARNTNTYPSHTDIPTIEFLSFEGPNVTDLTLSILKDAVKLKDLTLRSCDVTDEGLKALEGLSDLEYLAMYQTKQIDGSGLRYLPDGLKELELVTQRDCNLAHVSRFKNLEMISIYEARTTDEDLLAIKELEKLTSVNLGTLEATEQGILCIPKVMSVLSSFSGISDANMVTIANNFPNLMHIEIGGSKITDATCEALCRVTSLRSVNFSNSAITEAGRKLLKAAIPECVINGELAAER